MSKKAKWVFALNIRDFNPEHQQYIRKIHKIDSIGRVQDPFTENSNGGDLALYFLSNENEKYRRQLSEKTFLHLITHMPKKIYKAPVCDMSLFEYAVQQYLTSPHTPKYFLSDEVWIKLQEKGQGRFIQEVSQEGSVWQPRYLELDAHLSLINSIKVQGIINTSLGNNFKPGKELPDKL